jgi:hypothetical protein
MADANFKLNNRSASSDVHDPGLATGFSYFVPQEAYNKYVLEHADQKEVSDYISHFWLHVNPTTRLVLVPGLQPF